MFADDARLNSVIFQQFDNLVGIPCRDEKLETFGFQLRDDGNEKWDMRRIVQVDPDFFPDSRELRHNRRSWRQRICYFHCRCLQRSIMAERLLARVTPFRYAFRAARLLATAPFRRAGSAGSRGRRGPAVPPAESGT